jgi:hypothetical protein
VQEYAGAVTAAECEDVDVGLGGLGSKALLVIRGDEAVGGDEPDPEAGDRVDDPLLVGGSSSNSPRTIWMLGQKVFRNTR